MSKRPNKKGRTALAPPPAGQTDDLSMVREELGFYPETQSPLAEGDRKRLLRLLERTLGTGFRLAVVEVSSAVDRQAVMTWLGPHFKRLGARVRELNVAELSTSPKKTGYAQNDLWQLLHSDVALQSLAPRQVLVLSGFEDLMYKGRVDRSELLQQINVQRDLFVRDFPCWWLLFIHPSSRQRWYQVAPDFSDFVSCWIETQEPVHLAGHGLSARIESQISTVSSVSPSATQSWPAELKQADALLTLSHYDEALDLIHTFRARVADSQEFERGHAIAAMLEATISFRRGEPETALRALRGKALPLFQRLGDERLQAETMGQIADILQQRGEYEEALRIYREEELPVYERLGDLRSRAVTMSQIADILQQRGETDEALRIHREEQLPVFERLGDLRERAVTMGKIADILQQRGETDEALRTLREEALPDFERLGDLRSRAVTMSQIADILQQRGETDEALRIHREEELPVYERLGDLRERAVTMGRIADILQQRGQTDEALRIRREEELPVHERLGDLRERAVTMGRIADILQQRGENDEALRIRREEELPVFERLGDVRERAVTMGKIADILQQRGETDEALRIRREEQLPVYERLGDVRSRAVTMGKIADILQQRGETDEALRIRREEEMPVYERLGDVRSRAVTMGRIADILQQRGETEAALRIQIEERLPVAISTQDMGSLAHIKFSCARLRLQMGGLKKGEAQTILNELEESFGLSKKLRQMDAIAFVGWHLGHTLGEIGKVTEAIEVLGQAAEAFEKLKQPDRVAQVRALQKRLAAERD